MFSVRDSRNKRKKNGIIIERVAYSFLYFFSIAIFYLIWGAIKEETIIWGFVYGYIIFYLVFLIGCILIINDLYNNYNYFIDVQDGEGIKLIEETHYLCANPICPRCGGWYWGLLFSLTITLGLKDSAISILNNSGLSPYILIVLGVSSFLITTPFHGTLNFLSKDKDNNKFKLFCGVTSGFSLCVIIFGIVIM